MRNLTLGAKPMRRTTTFQMNYATSTPMNCRKNDKKREIYEGDMAEPSIVVA
jgi:hypothetical protein